MAHVTVCVRVGPRPCTFIHTMPKGSLIGPLIIEIGDGRTGKLTVCRNGVSEYKAVVTLNDEVDPRKKRLFGTGRQSIEVAVVLLLHSKLTMMTASAYTRVTSEVHELIHGTPRCHTTM